MTEKDFVLTPEEKLGEECGVFGAFDLDGGNVASSVYYGLFALQHRGQESCGIAVIDKDDWSRNIMYCKGMGLVNEVFNQENLGKLDGAIGIGHVRYSTAGASCEENTQPLVLNYIKGKLALAHNGNLVNVVELREDLEQTGAIFQTSIDSELIAYNIARERLKCDDLPTAVRNTVSKLKGSFSIVLMNPKRLIGVRDPFGFRPLVIGKRDNTYFLSSETCALDNIGAEVVRDVRPGEIVYIDKDGLHSDTTYCHNTAAKCIFEYIYFARPDSIIDNISVYQSRLTAGRILAEQYPVDADIVVGVPESGNMAALGYAMASGIPYGVAFIKNNYIGRTFIKPKQSERESAVKIKLNVLKSAVAGKRVIMVDDSIVRGTTSKRIIAMLRQAGAKEVHVRISSPPFLHPCYYGTDVPSRELLVATGRTNEEIRELIGADSLGYLPLDKLSDIIGGCPHYCDACFSGKFPISPPEEDIRGEHDK